MEKNKTVVKFFQSQMVNLHIGHDLGEVQARAQYQNG
ncbi:Uncharacterised protein [Klebsiella variicola]|nr:Uncharacterised protein [Klebsiella quasipneumoniae]SXF28999.1 Uncharacterised protein [Klebsiella variicola]